MAYSVTGSAPIPSGPKGSGGMCPLVVLAKYARGAVGGKRNVEIYRSASVAPPLTISAMDASFTTATLGVSGS